MTTIYALLDPETNAVRYVGLTRYPRNRFRQYANAHGHTLHMNNWLSSLRSRQLTPKFFLLEEAQEAIAGEREAFWISECRQSGCVLLNFTTGGEQAYKVSDEVRAKLSVIATGKRRPMSDKHKAAISRALKGRKCPHSVDLARRMSAAQRGTKLTDEHKRKVSEGIKRAWTPELRARVSLSKKGKSPHSWNDGQRQKLSELVQGWHRNNRAAFLESMRKRGCNVSSDPRTGRFIKSPAIEAN